MSVGAAGAADAAPPEPVPVALALGSNVGSRLAHLAGAVAALAAAVDVEAVSSVYASDPVGYQDQGEFLNAVLVGRTRLAPRALLEAARGAEAAAGRRRPFRNAPRTLDVDLILYGSRVVREADLVVPHPRWRERAFVLAPLAEVAGGWVDPETGRTVRELAAGTPVDGGRPRTVAAPAALWAPGGAS